jgi:hypothetical protein
MDNGVAWDEVVATLAEAGWQARVVPMTRLGGVTARIQEVVRGSFEADTETYLLKWTSFELPVAPTPRSVIVGAVRRPLTQAVLTRRGEEHTVQVPPHYAGYHTTPEKLAVAVRAALEPFGYSAARFEPPLKTLVACSGLTQYGYNNIAYVESPRATQSAARAISGER